LGRTLGGHVHVHGWSKGSDDDDDSEDSGTGIESDDEYDLYTVMENERREGWKRIGVFEAWWWYESKRR
jgi:hypothetical protein